MNVVFGCFGNSSGLVFYWREKTILLQVKKNKYKYKNKVIKVER